MKLPTTTSKLLALQKATNAELRQRLADVFKRYRSLAFAARNDNLFTEHWTPEIAAAGYELDGFEVNGSQMELHGVENSCGFIYRISIRFPVELIDDPAAIEDYFQRQFAEAHKGAVVPANAEADSSKPPANSAEIQ
jgi:hypothetical protein